MPGPQPNIAGCFVAPECTPRFLFGTWIALSCAGISARRQRRRQRLGELRVVPASLGCAEQPGHGARRTPVCRLLRPIHWVGLRDELLVRRWRRRRDFLCAAGELGRDVAAQHWRRDLEPERAAVDRLALHLRKHLDDLARAKRADGRLRRGGSRPHVERGARTHFDLHARTGIGPGAAAANGPAARSATGSGSGSTACRTTGTCAPNAASTRACGTACCHAARPAASPTIRRAAVAIVLTAARADRQQK